MSLKKRLRAHWKFLVAGGVMMLVAFGVGRFSVGEDVDEEEVTEEEGAEEYTCPMHPEVREPEMGICPICQMDLVPADDLDDADSPGVHLDEVQAALAGIVTTPVEQGPVSTELDVFGRVEVDEEMEVDIAAWVGGRIESLQVNATGERVERGQLLARIYSPQLYSAQRSLVQAVRSRESAEQSGSDRRVSAAESSVQAARTELRLLGVDDRQIDEIEETRQAREVVNVYATASGTIRERHVAPGDYVDEGDQIFSLAPLETVWGQLEIYERDLQHVSEGTPVSVEVPALGGEPLDTRVEFVSPQVDDSRVARARVVLDTEEGPLKPGMYLTAGVEVSREEDDLLSVPRSAVLWTGQRSLVYLYRETNHEGEEYDTPAYVPQPVKLGPRMGDRWVVEEGLSAEDTVVKRGAYRIDADLQIVDGPTMTSTIHDEGVIPVADDERVDVPPEGQEFDPPIEPEQLPGDEEFWYCDMGTVHWAQGEEHDAECPLCSMDLTHHEPGDLEDEPADEEPDEDAADSEPVEEVPDEGVEFDPPIEPEQLPDDQDLWFCDMGTVEWAQGEEGDAECPICGMDLTHLEAENGGGNPGDGHDHHHHHDHDHDHGGHDHVH